MARNCVHKSLKIKCLNFEVSYIFAELVAGIKDDLSTKVYGKWLRK